MTAPAVSTKINDEMAFRDQQCQKAIEAYYVQKSIWWGLRGKRNDAYISYDEDLMPADEDEASAEPFANKAALRIHGLDCQTIEAELEKFDSLPWVFRVFHPRGRSYYQKHRALLCCYYAKELINTSRFDKPIGEIAQARINKSLAQLKYHTARLSRFSRIRKPLAHYLRTLDVYNSLQKSTKTPKQSRMKWFRAQLAKLVKRFRKTPTQQGRNTMFRQDSLYGKQNAPKTIAKHLPRKNSEAERLGEQRKFLFYEHCQHGERLANDILNSAENKRKLEQCIKVLENYRQSTDELYQELSGYYHSDKWDTTDKDTLEWCTKVMQANFRELWKGFKQCLNSQINAAKTSPAEKVAPALSLREQWQADVETLDKLYQNWRDILLKASQPELKNQLTEITKEITKKYRDLAKTYHPDKNLADGQQSEVIFKALTDKINAIREGLALLTSERGVEEGFGADDIGDLTKILNELKTEMAEKRRLYMKLRDLLKRGIKQREESTEFWKAQCAKSQAVNDYLAHHHEEGYQPPEAPEGSLLDILIRADQDRATAFEKHEAKMAASFEEFDVAQAKREAELDALEKQVRQIMADQDAPTLKPSVPTQNGSAGSQKDPTARPPSPSFWQNNGHTSEGIPADKKSTDDIEQKSTSQTEAQSYTRH